jgi:hypothetical protein
MATAVARPGRTGERSAVRAVALPSEHGGWGLTLEPVLLGLLIAWSWAGLLIGLAAFTAFVVRTPLKLVAVDVHRRRWLARTTLAAQIAAAESVVAGALVTGATALAGAGWWVAAAAAMPLVAVEAAYEARSRGRRLVPELCGAIGVAGVAAAIVVAAGEPVRLAAAAWLVLAARSIGAIPFVRAQIVRARRGTVETRASDVAQVAALAVGAGAVWADQRTLLGVAVLAAMLAAQAWWSRRQPPAVKVIGLRQMALGLALVAATAAGVRLG